MFTNNWFNNQQTVITAWGGSTIFSGLKIVENIQGIDNFFTIVGWTITTFVAILAGISRWKLNKSQEKRFEAEAQKFIAEAFSIQKTVENTEDDKCLLDNCVYKKFYDNFYPIMIRHFNEGIVSANNEINGYN